LVGAIGIEGNQRVFVGERKESGTAIADEDVVAIAAVESIAVSSSN
jgi:hypothetical protein